MTDFADDCDYSTTLNAHEEGFMAGWIGREESRNPFSFYTARSAHAAWFEAWCAGSALHNPDDMSADRQYADLDVYLSTSTRLALSFAVLNLLRSWQAD